MLVADRTEVFWMFLHRKRSIINPDFPNFHLKIVSRTEDIGNKISSSDAPSGWILTASPGEVPEKKNKKNVETETMF